MVPGRRTANNCTYQFTVSRVMSAVRWEGSRMAHHPNFAQAGRLRRLAAASASLVGAVVVSIGTTSLLAAPASAATSCTRPSHVNVSSGSGHGTKAGGTPIRVGPYSSCGIVRSVGASRLLYYHCWRLNALGHLWTHVRIAGTEVRGWVYNANLDDGGARRDVESCSLPGPHRTLRSPS